MYMIKKNTRVILEGEAVSLDQQLKGGMPLGEGETVKLTPDGAEASVEYKVVKKKIDYILNGEEHEVNVEYTLKQV